jgi:hypothetical protein
MSRGEDFRLVDALPRLCRDYECLDDTAEAFVFHRNDSVDATQGWPFHDFSNKLLEDFAVDILGHPCFAAAHFRQDGPTKP